LAFWTNLVIYNEIVERVQGWRQKKTRIMAFTGKDLEFVFCPHMVLPYCFSERTVQWISLLFSQTFDDNYQPEALPSVKITNV
jgi:hypothetical protein